MYKKLKQFIKKSSLLPVFFLFANLGFAQVVYFEDDFESTASLDRYTQDINSGSVAIVDNPNGTGKVLQLVSTATGFTDQTSISLSLPTATPNDEEYFLEYDYRTEQLDGRFDNFQLNPSPERIQFSLRNNGLVWLYDEANEKSESPASTITAQVWHKVKIRVNAETNFAELEIDGVKFGEFESASDFLGLNTLLVKVLNGATFYLDNLKVTTFGKPLPQPLVLPSIPADHPRVFVRPTTLDALKAKFTSPVMANYKTLLETQATAETTGTLPADGKVSRAKYRAIEASAFLYLVNDDAVAGNKAKTMILENFASLKQTTPNDQDRGIHRSVLTAAMVYDWCYILFSPAERTTLIAEVKRLVRLTEYGFPLSEQNYLTNHFGEEKIPDLLAFGIACYNEDPSIYTNVATELYGGLVPSRNFVYTGGKHHQGSSYTSTRFESEIFSTFIMTRMGAPRPYIEAQGKMPYELMYKRRPDGKLLTEGDDFNPDLSQPAYFGIYAAFITAQEFQDGYVQDEALRYENFINSFTEINDATMLLLIKDDKLARKSITELPLTKYFESPQGSMIARTGWDTEGGKDSNVAMAQMNIGEYHFGNHDHLDAGHFSLYYKGSLALDSGALSNSTNSSKFGGNSQHWFFYYQESLAHNTLAVRDPNEPKWTNGAFPAINQNEGGQRSKINSNKIKFSFEDVVAAGKQSEILAKHFGPDPVTPEYSYLKGDIGEAYTYPGRTPKVPEAKRSFVFLNLEDANHPAALIVYDKVSAAEANFEKRWLLHSDQEPVINENVTIIDKNDDGYNGRLVNHTLLPAKEDVNIKSIGGTGKEFYSEDTKTNHLLVSNTEITAHEAGRWRIEVAPKTAKVTDDFLNVMQVMDADGGDYLAVENIESTNMYGVKIADRVVFFNKSAEKDNAQRYFSLPESATIYKYLLTDLAAGSYDVSGAKDISGIMVTEDAGSLYFEGPAGAYSIVTSGSVADIDLDTIPNATDNCPLTPNTDQTDANTNGIGDVCEDADNDGVLDVEDNCPNTPAGVLVDVLGCEVLVIDASNYKVEVSSLTCVGSKNGALSVSVEDASYSYTFKVAGPNNFTKTETLDASASENWELKDLEAGIHEVCISIADYPSYEQCFEVNLKEPKPLSAFAKVLKSEKKISLQLEGATLYHVTVNNKTFDVTANEFTADLQAGNNSISVKTDLECQGKFAKELFISEEVTFKPNPTKGPFYISIPGTDTTTHITFYSLKGIKLIDKYFDISTDRNVSLDFGNYSEGVYLMEVNGVSVQQTIKVVKQ